jgi:hypothetical protein
MPVPGMRSNSFLSLSEQSLSSESAHSVANIIWLNETLPPFMTRDVVLSPFGPQGNSSLTGSRLTWTSGTTLYGVNVSCETSTQVSNNSVVEERSSWGCRLQSVTGISSASPPTDPSQIYSGVYAGYYNPDGMARYDLSAGRCPKNESQTFYIQWSKALQDVSTLVNLSSHDQLERMKSARVWCRSNYYAQEVQATVLLPQRSVLNYSTIGSPRGIPASVFNVTAFESAMNSGTDSSVNRTNFPVKTWPEQIPFIMDLPINLQFLSPIAPFALGALPRAMDDYLDPTVLGKSYEAAYRLLFARHMTGILSQNLEPASSQLKYSYETEAITVVPLFAYLTMSFLGVVALLLVFLMFGARRVCHLHADPADIAGLMSLTADSSELLKVFSHYDRSTNGNLEKDFSSSRFSLDTKGRLREVCDSSDVENDTLGPRIRRESRPDSHDVVDEKMASIVKGVRPTELHLWIGIPFVILEFALLLTVAGLYFKILKQNGMFLFHPNNVHV